MRLIFLYGLPGVGKLTVARELGQLTGYKIFHNHLAVDLVESVFEFGSQPFVELREKIWLEMFAKAMQANLSGLIFTFAFDRTVRPSFIEYTRAVTESSGGELFFVELTCSTEEVERRLEEPSRAKFGKLHSVERFRELKQTGAFVGPAVPADLVVDTTKLLASDTADLIRSSIAASANKKRARE